MSGEITVCLQMSGAAGQMDNYCDAIRALGGEPRAGYCPAPDLSCGGLVLCGGGDIESTLFGQENRGSNPPDRGRDRAELELFRAFYEAGKPILGICRGMQLINVALGGTLIQDLPPDQRARHNWAEGDLTHSVRARPGSLLHDLYGPSFQVNSAHHQAVDQLGEGLRAAAWSEEGLPEALEWNERQIMAFQFHPERMSFGRRRPDTIDAEGIFRVFLELCWGSGR
ncbi:gamma-glutamyl-gamma-aminobutyrate hydrolase family protein [Colidextribacter sp. OB.20]|uniref:gamma-glutamyl-gamma-aminobutyrate hydrolase family protein n=1 Tax=Colidextribacter sp. OB.20 TaxID=2304568 RepID=UPI00136FD3A8|nr:gamma-glutamyl-gamma-aminobutyrate hydrolase family protein [Colidextribacter sp. OB.20]NBI10850.1 gamma-glutamyl-gamma-aminobutyrate hydrolase family protein [Colidextribacter sp. OB.20]